MLHLSPVEKQEIWRKKQFFTFYESGRPIFDTNKNSVHYNRYYYNSFQKRMFNNNTKNIQYQLCSHFTL
jgi:hypothetical protein